MIEKKIIMMLMEIIIIKYIVVVVVSVCVLRAMRAYLSSGAIIASFPVCIH